MTVDEVDAKVAEIKAAAPDDEEAHGLEDQLHAAVLSAIAAGCDRAPELAAAALKTHAIGFHRWYA